MPQALSEMSDNAATASAGRNNIFFIVPPKKRSIKNVNATLIVLKSQVRTEGPRASMTLMSLHQTHDGMPLKRVADQKDDGEAMPHLLLLLWERTR